MVATAPVFEHLALDHMDGCPSAERGAGTDRIESYTLPKPIHASDGAFIRHETVQVTRCQDCGADTQGKPKQKREKREEA